MNDIATENQVLPQWKCHKVVEASKVELIEQGTEPDPIRFPNGSWLLSLEGVPGCIEVAHEWVQKHNPQVGGYFVRYADGYTSYSPAPAFEDGYARLPGGLDGLKPYQQRVVIEAAELEPRLEQLTTFLGTETFEALPADEAEDLRDQHDAMADYLARLKSRIARFNPPTGPEPSGGQ